jgi:ElaB/YqjD/DUF883 family membrane-anchored ribosome-binding protein
MASTWTRFNAHERKEELRLFLTDYAQFLKMESRHVSAFEALNEKCAVALAKFRDLIEKADDDMCLQTKQIVKGMLCSSTLSFVGNNLRILQDCITTLYIKLAADNVVQRQEHTESITLLQESLLNLLETIERLHESHAADPTSIHIQEHATALLSKKIEDGDGDSELLPDISHFAKIFHAKLQIINGGLEHGAARYNHKDIRTLLSLLAAFPPWPKVAQVFAKT